MSTVKPAAKPSYPSASLVAAPRRPAAVRGGAVMQSARAPSPALPPTKPSSARPVANWNNEVAFTPKAIYVPTTEAQIMAIMRREPRVRVGGALHSFNTALKADSDTAFVDMTLFNAVGKPKRSADGRSATVWVQAGATLEKVATELYKHGLALENHPTLVKITIGGAIANGAHGSGLSSRASLSEQVVGMEVITSSGKKKVVSEAELPLYRLNLGLLGVVTRIQLRAVPDFNLMTQDDRIVGEAAVTAALEPGRLRREVGALHSAIYFINPDLGSPEKTELVRWGLVPAPETIAPSVVLKQKYDVRTSKDDYALFKAYQAAADATGDDASRVKAALRARFQPRPQSTGRSSLMHYVLLEHPAHDVSYGVPFERAQETYVKLMAKQRELGFESPIPMSMRFLRGTHDTLMAMNSGGRDVAVFEIFTSVLFDDPKTGETRADFKQMQAAFESIMAEVGGRPHWAKEFATPPGDRFPAADWDRFAREHHAVGSKLVNEWATQLTPAGSR